MELDIWQGDWTLPSVDLTCLQVMVNFLKQIKYPINNAEHIKLIYLG